jgi:FkbM family methyltransferase
MVNSFGEIARFYERLVDDESKALFKARWDYLVKRDMRNLIEYLYEANCKRSFRMYKTYEKLNMNIKPGEKAVIVGLDVNSAYVYTFLESIYKNEIVCFATDDSSKLDKKYFDKPVVLIDDLKTGYEDCTIVISVFEPAGREKAFQQLVRLGIKSEKICLNFFATEQFFPGRILFGRHGTMYFDLPYIKPLGEEEVFMDVGCFDGATTNAFIEWNGNQYSKIYAFEPDPKNYNKCAPILSALDRVQLFNAGAWSSDSKLKFRSGVGSGARVNESGTTVVEVVNLDNLLQGEKATFIKMDVEGAELEALKGVENTIRKFKPRLAISMYHKPEDIWEIPKFLMEIRPDYAFALRHYNLNQYETVLYAW